MNTDNDGQPPTTSADLVPRPSQPPRTNNQVKATALLDGLASRARWKRLIPAARAMWDKVHIEELEKVNGNIHQLAGLVQLRHQFSREESDRQVRAFMAQHDSGAM